MAFSVPLKVYMDDPVRPKAFGDVKYVAISL